MSASRRPRAPSVARPAPRKSRAKQAEETRRTLLRAAITVFARDGFAGGRIERISKLARSHDRMIYYYFGNKEKLFVAVLETIYAELYAAESALSLPAHAPREALTELVRFTWHYYLDHPEFVTILLSENLHRGRYARQSPRLAKIAADALSLLHEILAEGQRQGLFRAELKAQDLYITIAALGYFYNSNRYTLSAFLGKDLMHPARLDEWEAYIVTAVLRVAAADPPVTPTGVGPAALPVASCRSLR